MLVYQGTKKTFHDHVDSGLIDKIIYDKVLEKLGRHTPKAEVRSWRNSMQFMGSVLNDSEIPDDCGVAIEFNIPLTSKRVDFILSGVDEDGFGHANIIELKQWETAEAVPGMEDVVETYVGGGIHRTTHPSYQAWSYAETISDYNEAVQNDEIGLHPCAFLHNYEPGEDDQLRSSIYSEALIHAPIFDRFGTPALRQFLKAHISKGDDQAILNAIDCGRIRPSKSLQDALVSMLEGNREFVLLDDQKIVYEEAMHLAKRCKADGKKRVMVVEGGPGTGKSVVAMNLLVYLTKAGMTAQYISKNSAPRNVYSKLLRNGGNTKKRIDYLFKGSGSYYNALPNSVDALIVDEAHRLTMKSGMFNTFGENQTKEIIQTAQFSIFFIDRNQRISFKDAGSIERIISAAEECGAEVYRSALTSQFRCNGSDGYLGWLDNVLEIEETANYNLEGIDYEFAVFDSPEEMERHVRERNERNKARILAGYCWEWPTNTRTDPDYKDIVIGDWGISWNLDNTDTFAIDEASINEAGCIHTTQGLEFDYVGVIIGDDLRYEDGRLITDASKRAKTDKSLSGIKKLAKADPEEADKVADEIIKNTYRTLMTRGMKGCFVYCTDEGLRDYLRERSNEEIRYGVARF